MSPKKPITHHKKTMAVPAVKAEKYLEAVGRRKTAVARVRIYPESVKQGKSEILINNKTLPQYFNLKRHRQVVLAPYLTADLDLKTTVQVSGGGVNAQAEAVRLGIARVLVESQNELRPKLKAYGFLKRDPRMVERKKYGSRKARRPQQWRKR